MAVAVRCHPAPPKQLAFDAEQQVLQVGPEDFSMLPSRHIQAINDIVDRVRQHARHVAKHVVSPAANIVIQEDLPSGLLHIPCRHRFEALPAV
eukprot:1371178-Lingulodinium_polyedra.AAC.1